MYHLTTFNCPMFHDNTARRLCLNFDGSMRLRCGLCEEPGVSTFLLVRFQIRGKFAFHQQAAQHHRHHLCECCPKPAGKVPPGAMELICKVCTVGSCREMGATPSWLAVRTCPLQKVTPWNVARFRALMYAFLRCSGSVRNPRAAKEGFCVVWKWRHEPEKGEVQLLLCPSKSRVWDLEEC